jgi:heme/copper-type cytochrome/quinol oxidase subunit 4
LGTSFPSKRFALFIVLLLMAIIPLGIHMYQCFQTTSLGERKEARFTLIFSLILYLLFLCGIEIILPPLVKENTFHRNPTGYPITA